MSTASDVAICNDYIENKLLPIDIAKKYNLKSLYVLNRILKVNNVERKNRSELSKLIVRNRNCGTIYTYNMNYFNEWSNNMAYILGLIAADGNVCNGTFKIALKSTDYDILEKVKNELGYSGSLKYETNKCKGKEYRSVVLSIHRMEIIDALKTYNITANKSFTIKMPDNIPNEFIIDYIRGYFDGDGCVGLQYPGKTQTAQIRTRICSGSRVLLEQFRDYLVKCGLRCVTVTNKFNIFEICYSTKNSLVLYDMFYNNSNALYLDRKKEKFEHCIQIRNSDLNSKVI